MTLYLTVDMPALASGEPVTVWPSVLPGCREMPSASSPEGVADIVADKIVGAGAITYGPAADAIVRQIPDASIQNAAGDFTLPNSNSVQIGLSYATTDGDSPVNIDYAGADPAAYFPATFSYILAQTTGFDPGKGATLGRFLCYATGPGQARAAALLYAPLSSNLVSEDANFIAEIPGAPTTSNCPSGPPADLPDFPTPIIPVALATVFLVAYTARRHRRSRRHELIPDSSAR
jgi:phosphate transport system substrate-binding protein